MHAWKSSARTCNASRRRFFFALSGRSGRAEDVVHPPLPPPPHPPSPSAADDMFGDEPEALPDPLSPNGTEAVLGDEPEGSPAGSRTPGARTSSP